MLDLYKFAERLDELLFETNLTQKQFANEVKLATSKVCEYLKAVRTPSVNTLVKIADYFQCTTDYLLGFEQEKYTITPKVLPKFCDRLRQILQHYGYTGYRFCKEAKKINATRFQDWLKGKFVPNLESIVNIAEFFDCTVDFVLGRSE